MNNNLIEPICVNFVTTNLCLIKQGPLKKWMEHSKGVGEGARGATRDLVTVKVVNKVEEEVITHLIITLGVISSILYGITYYLCFYRKSCYNN